MNALPQQLTARILPPFSSHTAAIASEGAAGWAIADAAAEARSRGEDVVSLCLGDTSFDTPDRIVREAIESLRTGRTHYAPVPGTPELRTAIAAAQTRFDGGDWSADQVTVFGGAQNALFAAVMAVAGVGDEVLFFEPWYATYEATIRAGGATARPVGITLDSPTVKITEAALVSAITGRTRAILLNSPNNPGGYILDRRDLETVVRVATQHNLWIISDEVYRSAVFDEVYTSVTAFPEAANRTIVVNSLSKSHAMTGWRVGWTLSPPGASEHFQNMAQCMLFGSPTFIQDAAAVALDAVGDQEVIRFTEQLHRRRDMMCEALSAIQRISFIRPRGGMFCFADVSMTGHSGADFAGKLYREERLAVVPGTAFGPNMGNYIRISFSASDEVIHEGMRRLRRFCANL
ncbi:aspartate/tyrosine/aromatic aminotransferase [Rhizobium leguminosarum bv. trifolii WSM597]|uniref:Aminotransferase n=1 Tax=Rhizobium leguminosarum bv. trifolii WSM597 TaxID=754764 RepID=I9NJW1_RHILT|nr:pyridoxal phosphate-dependent aminotransferase [Rhizobium leguminosarum]EJB07027.1 aspartate/tyrosine/aromatic aminotransferase [Rhizobium leguminosarum bv. trifolii WSM597]